MFTTNLPSHRLLTHAQLPGNLRNRSTRIDHPMRGLNPELGHVLPSTRHTRHPSSECPTHSRTVDVYFFWGTSETPEFKDRSGAWRCVQRALQQRGVTATDRYRMVRYAELENLHRAPWQAAELGDHDAVLRCLRVAEERTKLLDLV